MGKRVFKVWDLPSSGTLAALVVLSAAFLFGGLVGCMLAKQVGGEGDRALTEYLQYYLSAAVSGKIPDPEWFSVLWETVRWPLVTFALGLTPLGLIGIPIVFFIRGFLLSFAIASFFRVLGGLGLALSFVVFGVSGLICIPILFSLGVQGILYAGALTGRLTGDCKKSFPSNRIILLHCGVCIIALFISCFIEYNVIPVLTGTLAGFLPA